jgi:hypothetical protein
MQERKRPDLPIIDADFEVIRGPYEAPHPPQKGPLIWWVWPARILAVAILAVGAIDIATDGEFARQHREWFVSQDLGAWNNAALIFNFAISR